MRRLTIRTERLAELAPAELSGVGGGQRTTECVASVLDGACVLPTLDHCFTGVWPTLNDGCRTALCA